MGQLPHHGDPMDRRKLLLAGATAGVAWSIHHASSPAVRGWSGSALPRSRCGDLAHRAGGHPGRTNHLLLHGLVATGDVFGSTADRLASDGRTVVPDLLGFGGSLDESRSDFSSAAHLAALDALVTREFGADPIRIGAHSMGSAVAIRWAAANAHRVERVVCLGAPIWPTAEVARASLATTGPMAKAFELDGRIARTLCRFNCSHRVLAGIISAAVSPRWPIPLARQASLHTWPAFAAALNDQIIETPWNELLTSLDDHGVAVDLVWGSDDRVGDPAHAREIAARGSHITIRIVDGADHTIPAARPDILVEHLSAPRRS